MIMSRMKGENHVVNIPDSSFRGIWIQGPTAANARGLITNCNDVANATWQICEHESIDSSKRYEMEAKPSRRPRQIVDDIEDCPKVRYFSCDFAPIGVEERR
jgi:hypothetical protein